ncbi:MAG: prepilin-type N-terminal cleavage/methylation domain-containing protein [Candidatus Zixiibacteriota bacterium]|nr:MAG: prepilin-type N-terminal cleavage/methylation domain-containing protein [candidate division Zixibacteria bacterium]
MKKTKTNRWRNCRGFTVLEVLIAALITGILAVASFRFYTSMHQQTETQIEVSDVQHLCRSSVHEIKKTLRLAGFKLDPAVHAPYEVKGDSLAIYYSGTQPVDTVLYYLEEFAEWEYWRVPDLRGEVTLYRLMRKQNSLPGEACADFIRDVDFQLVDSLDSRTMSITVTAQVTKRDDSYAENKGYRVWSLDEQVTLRNVNL